MIPYGILTLIVFVRELKIKKMNNLLEDKNIVIKILNELSGLCAIPKGGFLAGGAVANTLLKMKYGKSYPINDLDIFIEEEEGNRFSNSTTPLRTNSLIIEGDYYECNIAYDHGSNYRIKDVSREGLLNWITISRVANRDNIRNYQYILNGFDFNCCQVGIDLSTNQIYYTDEFVEFLNTKQLEVTAIYTPAHTAMRLFKKKKELDCYCNIKKCIELLSQPLIRETRINLHYTQFGFYFSHKYKDMFMKYYSELKNYFKIVRFFDDKKKMWELRYHDINKLTDKDHAANWLDPTRSIPVELLNEWSNYNDVMWTLLPIKYNTPHKDITDILSGVNYNPLTFMSAYKIINGKLKKNLLNKNKMVIYNGRYTKMIALLNPNFCNCDFTKEHINIIENYISKFKYVLSNILKYKLNLQESILFCKDITSIINKEGEWITPVLIKVLNINNVAVKPSLDKLNISIANMKKKMNNPLITPTNVVDKLNLPDHIIIKELVSEYEINWAGNKLKNCLNNDGQGYKEKLLSGKVKIFVIMTPNSTSALELYSNEDNLMYKERQLLSTCNKKPSLYHRIISDIIINELNYYLLNSQYNERLILCKDIVKLNKGLLISTDDKKTDDNETVFEVDFVNFDGAVEVDMDLDDANEVDMGLDIPIEVEPEDIEVDEIEEAGEINQTLGDLDALRELREQLTQQRSTE